MKAEQIRMQSEAAYGQWAEQWRAQAAEHSKFPMKPFSDFENKGIGRAVLCVANGFSFEEHIETIKLYQHNVDILCCDKTLGHLLENGITPTYCVVCDANVDYEKYMEKYKDQLKDTIAFVNVCANPKWTKNGNWKDIYFFINKDIINSHLEFSKISGCKNFIPAGTNVSNAMVILLTQSDNDGKRNFFGYDKILLIGYDYSWRANGKYYAFDSDGGLKSNYMRHAYITTLDGDWAYTSGNLAFSAQWLTTYITTFDLPVVNCTKKTILRSKYFGNLAEQIQYKHKPEDAVTVRKQVAQLKEILNKKAQIEKLLKGIYVDHTHAFAQSV